MILESQKNAENATIYKKIVHEENESLTTNYTNPIKNKRSDDQNNYNSNQLFKSSTNIPKPTQLFSKYSLNVFVTTISNEISWKSTHK